MATPEIPEIETWPPERPSTKRMSAYTGEPPMSSPRGSLPRVISSSKRAKTRCSPAAGVTTAPAWGARNSSGRTRRTRTWARRTSSAGRVRSMTRPVSDGRSAPSKRESSSVTMP